MKILLGINAEPVKSATCFTAVFVSGLIGRSVTARPLVLSPSSILHLPSSHRAFIPSGTFWRTFQNVVISFSNFLKVA
jgi:hypothetical protein